MENVVVAFWRALTRNVKCVRRPRAKLRVIRLNAKLMFRRWFLSRKSVEFYLSFRAYLRLYRAGLRISNSSMSSENFEINRFYWRGRVMRDMPDIDMVNGKYSTVRDGHVLPLGHDRIDGLYPQAMWMDEFQSKH